jgi:S1-C subfamily serine protease
MTRLIPALLALCCVGAANARAESAIDPRVFMPLRSSIMKIHARFDDGRVSIGTGTAIGEHIVLTNCHVVSDGERIAASIRAGRHQAVAVHAASRHDLCFLKVPAWRGPAVELAPDPGPRIRQKTVSIGYTGGAGISLSEGRISALYRFDGDRLLQTTAAFSSGASGGALLDTHGRLLGVLTFRLPGHSGHYYAVPAGWINADMPDARDWQGTGTAIAPRPFWQGAPETLPFFMQVAPLEASHRWTSLIELANRWYRSEPQSAEPLITRARAQIQLQHYAGAIDSLSEATRNDGDNAEAWFELGRVLQQLNRTSELPPVRQHLALLDPELLTALDAFER